MYAAFAVILVALAAFSVMTFRVSVRGARTGLDAVDPAGQQLGVFLYVGAGALMAWSGVVVVVGVLGDASGRAERLSMVGLFTYAIYLAAAFVLHNRARRR